MRWFSTPKTLALASGLALALAGGLIPATAFAQTESKAIGVDQVTFKAIQDTYNSQNPWLMVRVDLTAKSNPDPKALNPQWVSDVTVSVTLGWGSKNSSAPKVDVALTSSIPLVGLQVNTKSTVMFFVTPEFLHLASKNPSGINPNTPPDFYVVQVTAGSIPMQLSQTAVSSSLPDKAYVDGFGRAAADALSKSTGMMLPPASTPFFIFWNALQQSGGNMVLASWKAQSSAM